MKSTEPFAPAGKVTRIAPARVFAVSSASISCAPGFMRTERVLAAHKEQPFDLSMTESPEYVGRAVAALAGDPELMRLTGEVLTAGDLARAYGFNDVDGSQPRPFRLPE